HVIHVLLPLLRRPPRPPLFLYTTLFRSEAVLPDAGRAVTGDAVFVARAVRRQHKIVGAERHLVAIDDGVGALALHDEAKPGSRIDRNNTRLNSSHDQISYAVFCLKKKRI